MKRITRGRNDISHALINFKLPAQNRSTPYVYEITLRLWMDGEDVVVTESGPTLEGTVGAVMDAADRQIKKQRDRKTGR